VSVKVTGLDGAGGSSLLRIRELSAADQLRIIGMEFGWVDQNNSQKGFKRRVMQYDATGPGYYADLTLDSALPADTLIPIDAEISVGIRKSSSTTISESIASSGPVSYIKLSYINNVSHKGYVKIGDEFFSYTGIDFGANKLTGITRSLLGSYPAAHNSGATIREISGLLTTSISVLRASSHDFLNIGTGGYNTTNYPNNVFGDPVEQKVDSNSAVDYRGENSKAEVQEKNKGRVFFISTNQDGYFRVGRFFTIDQGTGNVSFNANISLASVDGLGFKRGITVREFSNDATMPDLGDATPTNSAVREYINRRLGLDQNGIVNNNPISPGYMPRNGGLAATSNMNLGGNKIVSLGNPSSNSDAANKYYVDLFLKRTGGVRTGVQTFQMLNDSTVGSGIIDMNDNKITALSYPTLFNDAANKQYVDDSVAARDQLSELRDVNITSPGATPLVLVWNNATARWINATIANSSVSASAAIDQSKLNLLNATAGANVNGVTKGISGFNDVNFTAVNGFVSIKTYGVQYSNLAKIPDRTAVANIVGGESQNPVATSISLIISEGIKDAFNSVGVVALTQTVPSKTVATIPYSSASAANNLVIRDSSQGFSATGTVNVGQLNVDSVLALDTSISGTNEATRTLNIYTPQGEVVIAVNGTSTGKITSIYGTLINANITTGSSSTDGYITGNWHLTGGSRFEATYADLAEYYEGDRDYEVGTVIMLGGDKEVTIAKGEGTRAVAGVVSNNAAYTMNSSCTGIKVLIALQGRVLCKVVGKIKKGDLLVVSSVPGVAWASEDPRTGSIIGKAIQDYDSDRIGTIEVMVGKH
jgi:hypothetical protein